MSKDKWVLLAMKLPGLIQGSMRIVQRIKNADGKQKKDAVIESIPEAIELTEFGVGKDLVNDPAIQQLISAYIDAEKVAMKAKAALQAGVLAKQPAA